MGVSTQARGDRRIRCLDEELHADKLAAKNMHQRDQASCRRAGSGAPCRCNIIHVRCRRRGDCWKCSESKCDDCTDQVASENEPP